MARVLLSRYECTHDLLPPVCARCGQPADGAARFTLTTPASQYLLGALLTVCPPLFVTLAIWLRSRSSFRVPLCEPDRADWEWRDRATRWGYVFLACVPYLVGFGLVIVSCSLGVDGLWVATGGVVGYFVGWYAWIVPAVLVWTRTVRTSKVNQRGIHLAGVHPEFVKALEADRAADPHPARRPAYGDMRDDYDDEEG